jgi:CheY-like chemotaxis protein
MPPLHILFVDDDSDESYLFNEALEHSGLHINLSRANDGNHLISLLQNEQRPDLIIMDINMPYKDGVEALAEIRNNSQFKEIPIIIYSTTKNEKSIDDCYEKGANLFVVKPNNFDGMVRVVKEICTMDWKNYKKRSRKEFLITEE